MSERIDQHPWDVGDQTEKSHPGLWQAACHELQTQQTGHEGQVLSYQADADEGGVPAQRRTQLVQHKQVRTADVDGEHDENTQHVKPQLVFGKPSSFIAAEASCRHEVPDGLVVAKAEESGSWVWQNSLTDAPVDVCYRG